MKSKAKANDRYLVILAGGRGERFWPLSRESLPKQFLSILGPRSFLQTVVDRVQPVVPLENILVITNAAQLARARKQLPKLPKENLVAEPCGRDTCAAVTLGAALVGARSTTAVMAVLPADHVIGDDRKFQRVLSDSLDLAGRGQVIVTIGLKPTEPLTGYGYIHVGEPLPPPHGIKPYHTPFLKAQQFVEKPHLEKAVEYVQNGHYRWNAGMFVWSFITLTEGLSKHQPEMAQACERWFKAAASPAKLQRVLKRDYPALKKISIDFALLEKAHNVVVAEGSFPWDDVGSWTALARHLPHDDAGNAVVGDVVHVDASRNLIYDARTRHRTPIAVVGLRDAILVCTDDATLIAHKSQAQRVKELVAKLAAARKYKPLV